MSSQNWGLSVASFAGYDEVSMRKNNEKRYLFTKNLLLVQTLEKIHKNVTKEDAVMLQKLVNRWLRNQRLNYNQQR